MLNILLVSLPQIHFKNYSQTVIFLENMAKYLSVGYSVIVSVEKIPPDSRHSR